LSQPDHQIEMHPNLHTSALIAASLAQGKQGDDDDDVDMAFFESRTYLDSHANTNLQRQILTNNKN
jgi:hypothetical protein